MTVPGRQGRRPLLWDRVYCIKFIICNKANVHGTMRASSPIHRLQVRGSIFTFLPGAMRASRPTEHFIVYRTFSSTIKPKATPHNSRLAAYAPLRQLRHGICVAKMLDNVGLRYPHRASGAKAPRTLRPLPLLRFAVSATGGAHLCSIRYYLRFWLGICRTSLAVSALRIMRYCPNFSFLIPN